MPRDIFLFDLESGVRMRKENHILLCNIKYGIGYASNFSNKKGQLKTPNIVMGFSNVYLKIDAMSEDRWLILKLNKEKITAEELGRNKMNEITS